MENNGLIQKSKVSTTFFVLGILALIATVVLFFIGYTAPTYGISIATIIVGAVSVVHFFVSGHAENGWVRMFSAIFIACLSVLVTLSAVSI